MDARINKFVGDDFCIRGRSREVIKCLPSYCSVPVKSGKKKVEKCGRACSYLRYTEGIFWRECGFHTEIVSDIIDEEKFERMEKQIEQME
tara:strand:- start:433 stop:702 length:270 start_codon:yes stop_codon:yes gene_type:complete